VNQPVRRQAGRDLDGARNKGVAAQPTPCYFEESSTRPRPWRKVSPSSTVPRDFHLALDQNAGEVEAAGGALIRRPSHLSVSFDLK
jgi:hypothetical protein